MTAYFVAFGTVKDADKLARYVDAADPIVRSFGGRFVAASEQTTVLLGEHPHQRIALFEFPSVAQCRAWYGSAEYRALWPLRLAAADFVFLVFEPGQPPQPVA
jgi:uncharacterized protein (DUF1330 family)